MVISVGLKHAEILKSRGGGYLECYGQTDQRMDNLVRSKQMAVIISLKSKCVFFVLILHERSSYNVTKFYILMIYIKAGYEVNSLHEVQAGKTL